MRGLQKSKRVSWATDGLCQVKLFVSEDTPSQVGISTQDHLQPKKKTAVLCNTGSGRVPGDVLPPGFEGVNPETQFVRSKLAHIPLAKWKCPRRFLLDPSWRITAGEGSNEVELENQRELRVLEAIYPRPSAIPPNPAVSLDAENVSCDDSRTLLVPITAIEEEDVCEEVTNASSVSVASYPAGFANGVMSSQYGSASVPNPDKNWGLEECAQPQLLAAASAALSPFLTGSGGPGGLIDHDLLVKILSNPAILEEFKRRQGNPSSAQDMPASSVPSQIAPSQPAPMGNPPPTLFNQMENSSVPCSSTVTLKEPFYPPQLNARPPVPYQHPPPVPSSSVRARAVAPPKDINYYKSLIQQHGGERQQEVTPDPVDNPRPSTDSKPRFTKQCNYFNSPKGCRHGAKCLFKHGSSLQQRVSSAPQMQGAKRMKMSRETTSSQPYS